MTSITSNAFHKTLAKFINETHTTKPKKCITYTFVSCTFIDDNDFLEAITRHINKQPMLVRDNVIFECWRFRHLIKDYLVEFNLGIYNLFKNIFNTDVCNFVAFSRIFEIILDNYLSELETFLVNENILDDWFTPKEDVF